MERLDKIIANMGRATRREVKDMVRQGRVSVDGTVVSAAEMKIDPNTAEIRIDGVALSYESFTYLLLHKPAGVVTATEDSREKTVLELLPPELRKRDLAPVGRLDKDTEGLLLLTNDGEMNHRLTSPRYHVEKTYYAEVDGCLEEADVTRFAAGIALSDFTCLPAKLEILTEKSCLVTVQEGKFHQVKRMLGFCGKPVIYLKRLAMGPLKLEETLLVGAFRPLTPQEVVSLREAAGL